MRCRCALRGVQRCAIPSGAVDKSRPAGDKSTRPSHLRFPRRPCGRISASSPSTLRLEPACSVVSRSAKRLRTHAALGGSMGSLLPLRGVDALSERAGRRVRADAANAQVRESKGLNGGAGVRWASIGGASLGTKVGSSGAGTTGTRRVEVARPIQSSTFESSVLAPLGVDLEAGRRAELERSNGA